MVNKIFGIGLCRTGTTTLSKCLNLLNFKCLHFFDLHKLESNYDSATDITVAANFKELDLIYPESKFIYTKRDFEEWYESYLFLIKSNAFYYNELFKFNFKLANRKIFGNHEFKKDNFKAGFYRYEESILEYFEDRKEDLLIWNLTKQPDWNILCDFLDCKKPQIKFPHLNNRK